MPKDGPIGNTDPGKRGRGVDRPSEDTKTSGGRPSKKEPTIDDADGTAIGGRDKK